MSESPGSAQPMKTRGGGTVRKISLSVVAQWKLFVAVMVLSVIVAGLRFTLAEPQVVGEVVFRLGEKPVLQTAGSGPDFGPRLAAILPTVQLAKFLDNQFGNVDPELGILFNAVMRLRVHGKNEKTVRQSFKNIFARISELEQELLEIEKLNWERSITALSSKIDIIEFLYPVLSKQGKSDFNDKSDSINERNNSIEGFILLVDQYQLWKSERSFLLSVVNDFDSMKSRIVKGPTVSSQGDGRLVRFIALTVIGGFLLGVLAALIVGFTRYLITGLEEAS